MILRELPLGALRALATVLYLNVLAAVYCGIRALEYRDEKKTFLFSMLNAFVSFVYSGGLAVYLLRISRQQALASVTAHLVSLPLWAIAASAGALTAVNLLLYIRMERRSRRELSARSVCEGLDQLPDGVCYSMPDGFPKLVNDRMQRISNAAFGVGVLDAKKLRERLQKRDLLPGCTVDERDGNLFLCLPDGSAWQMVERSVRVGKNELTEMIAYDVTQRYRDLLELEERNKHLEEVNRQIREYDRRMDRIVREKEILAAKIRLHGNLGQCLLAIQGYLNGSGDDRETVTRELADTVSLLRNNTVEEHTDDKLYALNEAAKTVGVEIRIRGDIPAQWKDVIEVAIHECLTNTVKHAGGRLLDVSIRLQDAAVTVELTNDGRPPAGPVRETGGLKNLRALVENRGGRMTVESAPVFRLVLDF
ncbi:MAG: ATP-binding protein [Clostridia bacterium]|nr:ATP-binding protein [Clostridia bacterium]